VKAKSGALVRIERSPECGDAIRVELGIRGNRITRASARAFGCQTLHAAAELIGRRLRGRRVGKPEFPKVSALMRELRLPPFRIHCVRLAALAFRKALDQTALASLIREKGLRGNGP
jgi:NifU-like protein involved in Fe-S cluster formation